MTIIVKYTEWGLIGEKEVEERKGPVEETLENIQDILKKFKRTVKKISSKTLCFCTFTDFEECSHNAITIYFNTYDDIENDIVTVYCVGNMYSEQETMPRSKVAKYIFNELQQKTSDI